MLIQPFFDNMFFELNLTDDFTVFLPVKRLDFFKRVLQPIRDMRFFVMNNKRFKAELFKIIESLNA